MSGEPETPTSQQGIPDWLVDWAIFGAAAICLLTSVALAIADRVAAGTLTAGLFVVCVLFHYLPQMESFKAFGIEAKWREYAKERLEDVIRVIAELEKKHDELKAQIAVNAPKETLMATSEKVGAAVTQASLAVALTAMDLTTGPPVRGTPTLRTRPKSDRP
jgi:hypothetical protein